MLTAALGTPPPTSSQCTDPRKIMRSSVNWRSKTGTSGEAPRGGEEGSHLQGPPCWAADQSGGKVRGFAWEPPDSEQVLIVGTGRPPVVAWRFAAAQRAPRVKADGPRTQVSPAAGYLMWGWLPISPPTGHCWGRNRHTKRLGGGRSLDNED